MNVKICSFLTSGALLIANIVQAADSNSGYFPTAQAGASLRQSSSDSSESELAAPNFDETPNSQSVKKSAPRQTQAESVLASHVEPESLNRAQPKFQGTPASRRTSSAMTSPQPATLPRTSYRRETPNSATPASYNPTRYAPSASTRTMPAPGTRLSQAQRPSEQFYQKQSRNSRPASYSASYATNQEHVGRPATSTTPETIFSENSIGAPDGNCADCAGDCCNDTCCNNGWMGCYNCCGWFGSVDYLLLRPTFSENTAYVTRSIELDEEENLTTTDTVVPRDFGYTSGIRTSLGYRFCDCGGEIRFTYWNFDNCVNQVTPRSPQDGSEIYIGQLETVTQVPGQRLVMENDLQFNLYDIEYSKCLCYGGCDPCNPCNCCPPWSLKYYAGVRIADIQRQDNGLLQNADNTLARAWFINGDFIGAGPRVGLEGRRFFGGGRTSLFARTNLSLLLGQWDLGETRKTPAVNPTTTENYFDSHTRMIPVAEIELGGNYQITRNINIGAGYMFQAWWDLGAFEQIQGNVFLSPVDDSNIMGLDGLFARFEMCF